MRAALIIASLALAGSHLAGSALADKHAMAGYSAMDLLGPCQEADSDARNGVFAEAECEQYIMGYVDALQAVGAKTELGICAPEQNTADEVRWAFTRWVHGSYSARTKMSASEALMGALKENFPCE